MYTHTCTRFQLADDEAGRSWRRNENFVVTISIKSKPKGRKKERRRHESVGHRVVIVRWKTQFEHERMRKQKWRKETSPPFSPLFQTKLDPSQISPTDRTDHPFLPSSILLHLLGATPTSDVATSEISFERTSRDARTKRYSNISTLSLPPDDTIFQFWFTT